jgi:hypothetical protein
MRVLFLSLLFVSFAVTIFSVDNPTFGLEATQEHPEDSRIAHVYGEEIRYSDIKVPYSSAVKRFESENGRSPSGPEDEAAVEQIRRESETSNLRKRIESAIRDAEAARLGVAVSQEEISERIDRLLASRDSNVVVDRRNQKLQRLLNALNEVYNNGADPNDVYERKLKEFYSTDEWLAAQRQFRDENARHVLEQSIVGATRETLESDVGSLRSLLLAEKLDKAIDQEIAREDDEYDQYLAATSKKHGDDGFRRPDRSFEWMKRQEWWESRHAAANVEILDPRFGPAWEN